MSSRFIIIDDTSSRITYSDNSWILSQSDRNGVLGTPYRNTLHGTVSTATFSFSFSGTMVEVFGANDKADICECLIDNQKIAGKADTAFANPLTVCKREGLKDGPHILTVNVLSVKDTFWFDRIHYTPSLVQDEQSVNENVYIESWDSKVKYGSGWTTITALGEMTNVTGFNFELDFTGVSVAWYSWIPPSSQYPGKPTHGMYSIDGGSPQEFALKGLGDVTIFNQLFFETSNVPKGDHKLTVAYNGNGETDAPLTLEWLIARSGTSTDDSSPPTISSLTSITTSTSTVSGVVSQSHTSSQTPNLSSQTGAPPDNHLNNMTKVGIIVGCVIAALFLCILLAYLVLSRRLRKQKEQLDPADAIQDSQTTSMVVPSPFVSGQPAQALGKRQRLHSQSNPRTDDASAVLHEDNGARMPDDRQDIVELPPQYTAG